MGITSQDSRFKITRQQKMYKLPAHIQKVGSGTDLVFKAFKKIIYLVTQSL